MCAPYLKMQNYTFPVVHKTLECTYDCNSVHLNIFAQLKLEMNFTVTQAFTYLLCQQRLTDDVLKVSPFGVLSLDEFSKIVRVEVLWRE